MYDLLLDALRAQIERDDVSRATAFDPHIFRLELESALDAALAEERLGRVRGDRKTARETRKAQLAQKAAQVKDAPRFPASTSILTEDWFSEAAKSTGEEEDVTPDEADPELRAAANFLLWNSVPSEWSDDYLPFVNRFERNFGVTVEEAQLVPLRTQDEIGRGRDDAEWLLRDEARAPKGYGMTKAEERRAWIENQRLRYLDMVREAMKKNRVERERAKAYPAIQSFVNLNRAIMARHAFIDELARHGVFNPEQHTVKALKTALGGTYVEANATLVARRLLAEAGKLDRYRHELVA